VDLLAVLIGGVLAIAGGIAAPIVQHRLQREAKAEEDRRQRLHELIQAVYDHAEYMKRRSSWSMTGGDQPALTNPMPRIHALILSDFSDHLLVYRQFCSASASYELWNASRMVERVNERSLETDGFRPMNEEYHLSSSQLLDAVTGQPLVTKEIFDATKAKNLADHKQAPAGSPSGGLMASGGPHVRLGKECNPARGHRTTPF